MVYLMHVCAAQVAQAGGAPEDRLRGMAADRLSTLAFSERGSRSHFWAPVSEIEGADGDERLAAQKSFVTSAGQPATYVVSTRPAGADVARVEPVPGRRIDAVGIETTGPWVGLGLRGNASAPMTFDHRRRDTALLGEEGKGLDLMLGVVLPWFQLGQGGVSLGHRRGRARRRGRPRHQPRSSSTSGRRSPTCPTVRARLGRCQTEVDALAGFLADLARRMAEGDAHRAGPVGEGRRERDGDPRDVRGDAGVRRRGDEPGARRWSGSSATRAPAR